MERIQNEFGYFMKNIILIGMPGVGKSTVAKKLGELTGRQVFDSDDEITRRTGRTPAQIIEEQGEPAFRRIESEVLRDLGSKTGAVIATGGGAVVREENYDALHCNGTIIWLKKNLALLANNNRPILQSTGAEKLYEQRKRMYKSFADTYVCAGGSVIATAYEVLMAVKRSTLWLRQPPEATGSASAQSTHRLRQPTQQQR